MQAPDETHPNADTPLQLLLFVDKRPSSTEQIRRVHAALKELQETCDFEIQMIDVTEQPYLAEYFRLVATPALLKIHPEPRQVLAGSNLEQQLRQRWSQWQRSVVDYLTQVGSTELQAFQKAEKALSTALSQRQEATLESDDQAELREAIEPSSLSRSSHPDSTNSLGKSVSYSGELLRLSDEIFRLQREKEECQNQLQFKDQIIAMLAHDLRNPLTATSIALETLELSYNSRDGFESRLTPEMIRQLLKQARAQTRVIDRMITDILQAARGSGSELQIKPQKLNLGSLCLEIQELLAEQFQAKNLQVKTDIPSDLPLVLADAERIQQVLINLLDNAIKYTPIAGTIELSALHRTAQKIQISICDTGPGIPPENQEQIFEERYRLERDEAKEGYGIGLSLCQRIIRAHYGQIWVDSLPNQGSCFHFTLPVFKN